MREGHFSALLLVSVKVQGYPEARVPEFYTPVARAS